MSNPSTPPSQSPDSLGGTKPQSPDSLGGAKPQSPDSAGGVESRTPASVGGAKAQTPDSVGGVKPPMRQRLAPKPDPVGQPAHSSQLLNLPNTLTALRIVLVLPFAILLFGYGESQGARSIAAVLFAIASVTDFLDGAIARKMNLVTNFGKIADPIADKALTGVALIGLSYQHELAWWITIVILGREIGVTLLRFWVIRHGVIAASRGGKLKTVFQILAIFLYLLPLSGIWDVIAQVTMGITVILALVTGVDYLIRALKLRNSKRPVQAA